MISDETARIAAAKRLLPESIQATLLLSSDRASKADVMCAQGRHKLARVYELDGRTVMAIPERKFLRAHFDPATAIRDRSEVVSVAWLFDLETESEPAAWISLRCRCGTWGTTVAKVRLQLEHLSAGDRWLMVSKQDRARRA